MGFLLLIAFSIYGLGCMCEFPEGTRHGGSLDNAPHKPDSRAKRPASGRPPVRPGTGAEGISRRTADEDTDDTEIIDELEYMRHFFH